VIVAELPDQAAGRELVGQTELERRTMGCERAAVPALGAESSGQDVWTGRNCGVVRGSDVKARKTG
jgi:hypothetical protein